MTQPGDMTRRAFLARTGALALAASSPATLLAACGRGPQATATPAGSPVIRSEPPSGSLPPVVDPTPVTATYGDLLETSAIAPVGVPSAALRSLLDEVTADAGIPVEDVTVDGRRQARLTIVADDASFASQAYRLAVEATSDGPVVTIRAGDEAGAWNGLLSLRRLTVAAGGTRWIRAATVDDAPGFIRRGAILDPFILPDTGVTAASQALLLERVRFGVRGKLNFVDLPDRTPWPELVRYCEAHHVELMVAKGYRDWLSSAPRADVKAALAAQLDAGARSIALNWDDIPTTNPEALARGHMAVFNDLYADLRGRDPGVRISIVLPPYGGIPGRNLVFSDPGAGERYLAIVHDALPADVRVFWTGDGGVFSGEVTTAGARAYADAVGHEVGLWDNDTITFSRTRKPCSGRAADLDTVVHAYMGNLAGEANWSGTNGEFALLTSLLYAWNPGAYDPGEGAATAERLIAAGPSAAR